MRGNILVEIFQPDFSFRAKTIVAELKYEFDYMALANNTLTAAGHLDTERKDYILIHEGNGIIQGIVTAVEYSATETKVKYKDLLSIIDIEVYKDRKQLAAMTAERFLGAMVEENFVNNSDLEQNIKGLSVEYASETEGATLNLKDNLNNIYDVGLKAFRKYGIVIGMELDVMKKSIVCRIGIPQLDNRVIEADLKNIISTKITLKDDSESINKVIVVGEYDDEDSEHYGQTITRTYYLDGTTGETTQEPQSRILPVVFSYSVMSVDPETFEADAYDEAYDQMYEEEQDNEIEIEIRRDEPLYPPESYAIGQPCTILKNGAMYRTIYTGRKINQNVTLLFGLARVAYTKNIRRR